MCVCVCVCVCVVISRGSELILVCPCICLWLSVLGNTNNSIVQVDPPPPTYRKFSSWTVSNLDNVNLDIVQPGQVVLSYPPHTHTHTHSQKISTWTLSNLDIV